jgi:hypothetical protein
MVSTSEVLLLVMHRRLVPTLSPDPQLLFSGHQPAEGIGEDWYKALSWHGVRWERQMAEVKALPS